MRHLKSPIRSAAQISQLKIRKGSRRGFEAAPTAATCTEAAHVSAASTPAVLVGAATTEAAGLGQGPIQDMAKSSKRMAKEQYRNDKQSNESP